MSKITVNETVTRSVSFENSQVDVQTALDRCFQFLEERRFNEAHVIIEQVLNIDPNNTDAHVANFLYQFKCGRIDWLNHKRYNAYLSSVFFNRIYESPQTPLRTRFMFRISELPKAIEEEKEANRFLGYIINGVILIIYPILGTIACAINAIGAIIHSRSDETFIFLGLTFCCLFFCYIPARMIYCGLKKKRFSWRWRG